MTPFGSSPFSFGSGAGLGQHFSPADAFGPLKGSPTTSFSPVLGTWADDTDKFFPELLKPPAAGSCASDGPSMSGTPTTDDVVWTPHSPPNDNVFFNFELLANSFNDAPDDDECGSNNSFFCNPHSITKVAPSAKDTDPVATSSLGGDPQGRVDAKGDDGKGGEDGSNQQASRTLAQELHAFEAHKHKVSVTSKGTNALMHQHLQGNSGSKVQSQPKPQSPLHDATEGQVSHAPHSSKTEHTNGHHHHQHNSKTQPFPTMSSHLPTGDLDHLQFATAFAQTLRSETSSPGLFTTAGVPPSGMDPFGMQAVLDGRGQVRPSLQNIGVFNGTGTPPNDIDIVHSPVSRNGKTGTHAQPPNPNASTVGKLPHNNSSPLSIPTNTNALQFANSPHTPTLPHSNEIPFSNPQNQHSHTNSPVSGSSPFSSSPIPLAGGTQPFASSPSNGPAFGSFPNPNTPPFAHSINMGPFGMPVGSSPRFGPENAHPPHMVNVPAQPFLSSQNGMAGSPPIFGSPQPPSSPQSMRVPPSTLPPQPHPQSNPPGSPVPPNAFPRVANAFSSPLNSPELLYSQPAVPHVAPLGSTGTKPVGPSSVGQVLNNQIQHINGTLPGANQVAGRGRGGRGTSTQGRQFMSEYEIELTDTTVLYLKDESINPYRGSVPVERIQNVVRSKHADLYNTVVGTRHNSWRRYVERHPDVFHLFSVEDGKWRMRLVQHEDWEEGDRQEQAERQSKERHLIGCLSLYLERQQNMSCKVDEFMAAYPTLPQNQFFRSQFGDEDCLHPLPARGDLVRFVRRHSSHFIYDSETLSMVLKRPNGVN